MEMKNSEKPEKESWKKMKKKWKKIEEKRTKNHVNVYTMSLMTTNDGRKIAYNQRHPQSTARKRNTCNLNDDDIFRRNKCVCCMFCTVMCTVRCCCCFFMKLHLKYWCWKCSWWCCFSIKQTFAFVYLMFRIQWKYVIAAYRIQMHAKQSTNAIQ